MSLEADLWEIVASASMVGHSPGRQIVTAADMMVHFESAEGCGSRGR